MKPYALLVAIALSGTAFANSTFDSIKDCINDHYKALTNRRSIAAAIVDADHTEILTFGEAKRDQIFEIGSITKTFTGNLLAQEIMKGKLRVTDPIPAEYQKPGSIITYQNLATHTSGIIGGIFPTFHITDTYFPYKGLTLPVFKELYAQTPLAAKPGEKFIYSNIGIALLGIILSEKEGRPYEDLVSERIFKVLGMNNSYFKVPESQQQKFRQGTNNGETRPYWNLYETAFDPAGGIRSTIDDMALYARANLIPESTPLGPSIALSHQTLYSIGQESDAMTWALLPDFHLIWHNGGTFGFNSMLAISTKHNVAVVALSDTFVTKPDASGPAQQDKALENAVFACLK